MLYHSILTYIIEGSSLVKPPRMLPEGSLNSREKLLAMADLWVLHLPVFVWAVEPRSKEGGLSAVG